MLECACLDLGSGVGGGALVVLLLGGGVLLEAKGRWEEGFGVVWLRVVGSGEVVGRFRNFCCRRRRNFWGFLTVEAASIA